MKYKLPNGFFISNKKDKYCYIKGAVNGNDTVYVVVRTDVNKMNHDTMYNMLYCEK